MINLLPHILANAEEPQGIAALGLDPVAIAAQAVTFLVAFWLIKKFALTKIVATLEQRRQTIDKGVLLGREMEAQKANLEARVAELLKQARAQADGIIADANQSAGQIIKAAEQQASQKVETMLADAHLKIEDDLKRARQSLEQEMLALVAEATEVIIDEKLNAQKDNSLIGRALAAVRR